MFRIHEKHLFLPFLPKTAPNDFPNLHKWATSITEMHLCLSVN